MMGPVALSAPCGHLLTHGALPSGPCSPALPTPTQWAPPAIDAAALLAAKDGASRLAQAIKAAPDGVLVLENANEAPWRAISDLFGSITPARAARANAAYQAGSSRLVWKDAHGEGRWVAITQAHAPLQGSLC